LCGDLFPKNFGLVEEDLYRSGQPNELNFPFLDKLGLKTIIVVSPEEPSSRLYEPEIFVLWQSYFLNFIDLVFYLRTLIVCRADFASDRDIELRHFVQASPRPAASSSVGEEVVVNSLRAILDQSQHPILVCCSHGRHHTG
jgi:tyrosine-protein phosphatase OCA1